MRKAVQIQSWLNAIAERAEVDVSTVEALLGQYRIEPSPVLPSPKRLLLKRIAFSGVKDAERDHAVIDFSWEALDIGLWALLTETNLRGKSSVLEIIRWLLRGSEPSNLQSDVRSWLKEACLLFELDDVLFEIEMNCENSVRGKLSRYSKQGGKRRIHGFESDDEFAAVMSSFFMHEFRMEGIAVHRKNGEFGGKTVLHGWQALSGAMFIGTDYTTLVGELPPATGLPFRVMQMYLGIPWVSTLAATKAAQAELSRKLSASNQILKDSRNETVNRVEEFNRQLTSKSQELSALPTAEDIAKRGQELRKQHADLEQERRRLLQQAKVFQQTMDNAEQAFVDDRKSYQIFVDGNAAELVFRALDPTCCPRCDHSIPDGRKKREHEHNACAVCGEQIHSDVPAAEIQKQLKDQMDASRKALASARKSIKDLAEQHTQLEASLRSCEAAIASESKRLSQPTSRSILQTEIAVLEARIEEASANLPKEVAESVELAVLDAIAVETDTLVKEVQADVLTKVSDHIVQYANRFGMTALKSATLRGNMSLSLDKGDSHTSYSAVTAGEKLRLKVATILAMLKVGAELGVGRYPGLLLIDSPAAQEISAKDLEQLISGLAELSGELEHLQVIVASIASRAILTRVSEQRARQAFGDDFLW